jgi:DNA-binding MarR family transcriptional regulator
VKTENYQLLSERSLKKFRIIFGSVRQQLRDIEKTCGITGSQLWIIHEISKAPGIGISELAQTLSIHQSTCSLLVDKLVQRKLVRKERGQEDQRRVGLHILPEAEHILNIAPGPADGILPDAIRALPVEELEKLDDVLEKVIRQLHLSNPQLAEKPLSEL